MGKYKIDKRAVKKKLYEAKRKGHLPGDPKVGERLLKQAQDSIKERKKESDRYMEDVAYDTAGVLRNKARGRVIVAPCVSERFCKNYDKIDWGR